MNNYDVDVNPKDFITTNTANKVELRVSNLQIGSSVDVTLLIKDLNGNIFKVENVRIEGEEYNNWGSDDQYLVNIVLSKVGLTQKAKESN
jgi:hypothetical protein